MRNILDVILRRNQDEPTVPNCPDHKGDMRLRGKLGRPSRFTGQSEEEYTVIYFCPVEGCNHTVERPMVRTQVPVPGEPPARPSFSRSNERP